MKNLSFLLCLSIAVTTAFITTLLFSVPAMAAYSSAFLLMIVAKDYTPRSARWSGIDSLRSPALDRSAAHALAA